MSSQDKPKNIRALRRMVGLKQVELAGLAGITQAYLSEIENGKKPLTKKAAGKIARAFGQIIGQAMDHETIQVDPHGIWVDHLSSFYPEEIQARVQELMLTIGSLENRLHNLLMHGDEMSAQSSNIPFDSHEAIFPVAFFMNEFREEIRTFLQQYRNSHEEVSLHDKMKRGDDRGCDQGDDDGRDEA